MNENYFDSNRDILEGSLPIKELYGKFPEFLEVMSVIRNIYGEDFMEIFEQGFENLENTIDNSNDRSFTGKQVESVALLSLVDEK